MPEETIITDGDLKIDFGSGFLYSPPKFIEIETTARCNLDCIICRNVYDDEYGLEFGDMSMDTFIRIMPFIKTSKHVFLSRSGEPLLHPQIVEFIKMCRQYPCKIGMATNGSLLNEDLAEKLVDSGLDEIEISVDGIESFYKIRGYRVESLIKKIEYFNSLKKKKNKTNPSVIFTFVAMKDNLPELMKVVDLAHSLGVKKVFVHPLIIYYSCLLNQNIYDNSEKTKSILNKCKAHADKLGIDLIRRRMSLVKDEGSRKSDKYTCMEPFERFHVNWRGNANIICCGGKDIVAEGGFINLKDFPIEDIWNCREYREIRLGLLKKNPGDFCKKCSLIFGSADNLEKVAYPDYTPPSLKRFSESTWEKELPKRLECVEGLIKHNKDIEIKFDVQANFLKEKITKITKTIEKAKEQENAFRKAKDDFNIEIEEKNKFIKEKERIIETNNNEIFNRDKIIKERSAIIADLVKVVSDRDSLISGYLKLLEEKDSIINSNCRAIHNRDITIVEYQKLLDEKESNLEYIWNSKLWKLLRILKRTIRMLTFSEQMVPKSDRKNKKSERLFFNMGKFESMVRYAGVISKKNAFLGPRNVQIDITNKCNSNCLYCWARSPLLKERIATKEWQNQELPVDLVKRLVKELKDMGVKNIHLSGGGEPFIHPHIMEIIEYIKANGIRCEITTNFTLVDRPRILRLLDTRVDFISVSLWAARPETYVKLHPGKTERDFEEIIDNITFMMQTKNNFNFNKNIGLRLCNVISNLNYQEIEQMIDLAERVSADSYLFQVMDPIKGYTDKLLLSQEERQNLLREVNLLMPKITRLYGQTGINVNELNEFMRRLNSEYASVAKYDKEAMKQSPCCVGWFFSRITADGNVNFCLKTDEYPLGNLYKNSFKEIWNSREYNRFRKNIFSREIDPYRPLRCETTCDNRQQNIDANNKLKNLNFADLALLRCLSVLLRPVNLKKPKI